MSSHTPTQTTISPPGLWTWLGRTVRALPSLSASHPLGPRVCNSAGTLRISQPARGGPVPSHEDQRREPAVNTAASRPCPLAGQARLPAVAVHDPGVAKASAGPTLWMKGPLPVALSSVKSSLLPSALLLPEPHSPLRASRGRSFDCWTVDQDWHLVDSSTVFRPLPFAPVLWPNFSRLTLVAALSDYNT